ncbi:response regulator transcription factor [Streptomyces griseosporeus]|uniref:response regulator transcription factor n=1 Tax=Streptomyces griseosporeus TaxID=1910 RepID=UPI0036FE4081
MPPCAADHQDHRAAATRLPRRAAAPHPALTVTARVRGAARPPHGPRTPKDLPMTAPVQTGPSTNGGPSHPLTARELELLTRVANGESYPQLAKDWGVEPISVRTTGVRVMRKLGANTITHAVFLAVQAGLLDPRRRHGDHAGFAAHRYRGEEPCEACWEGERAYRRERRAARKTTAAYPQKRTS